MRARFTRSLIKSQMIDNYAPVKCFRDFAKDLSDVLKRAKEAGVTEIVNAGVQCARLTGVFRNVSEVPRTVWGHLACTRTDRR